MNLLLLCFSYIDVYLSSFVFTFLSFVLYTDQIWDLRKPWNTVARERILVFTNLIKTYLRRLTGHFFAKFVACFEMIYFKWKGCLGKAPSVQVVILVAH